MICVECGSEMHKCSDPIREVFRGEELTVSGIEHYRCDQCGEIVFSAEDGKRFDEELLNQYAKASDLLSPSEIKTLRSDFGLKQTEFEETLGVRSPSVSRWESGKVCQSKPVDLLMRAYKDAPYLMEARMMQCGIQKGRASIIPFPMSSATNKKSNSFNLEIEYKEM